MSIKIKLGLTVVIIMSVLTLTMLLLEYKAAKDIVEESTVLKLSGDLATGEALLDAVHPGPWRVDGDKLYKGDTLINDNNQLVDNFGKLTGNAVTIFLGDTRIATNVIGQNGNRAVGTTAADYVVDTVIKQGQYYYGEAMVAGSLYQTAYKPIRDARGEVIGMWFTGVSKEATDAIIMRSIIFSSTAGIVALIIGVGLLIFMSNKLIISPLNLLVAGVNKYAEGDFREKIKVGSQDEIGQLAGSLNNMSDQLGSLIKGVVDNSQSIAAHSQELAASNEEISATMEEVASTTTEVSATADNGFENAHAAVTESEKVVTVAQDGNKTVKSTIDKINAIASSTADVEKAVNNLGQLSAQIGNITNVITGIAEQTNLLALNAAIEAARAGDAGRGFAVVAEEVRKLAEQSAGATKEINQLISQVQTGVDVAAMAMENGAAEVQEGVQLASEAGLALDNINNAVINAIKLIKEISEGSRQTSEGMEQVTASTEQVSSTIQQMATSSQELADIANKLQLSVEKFQV